MNKKILALLLAFAMMFSSITVAFANESATIGADAEALKTIGVLQGENSAGVTPEYLAKGTTRMQAAIMYLRLKGLEDEAIAFAGTANFADADTMTWAQGKAIMAYLKANPQLGWIGADGGKFEPFAAITVGQYYKVMLEALGYKQGTDFEWKDVMSFAAAKGLVKLAGNTNFTNNDVAIATIEALKTNVKDATTTLATSMVNAGMINKAAAITAGLYVETPSTVGSAIDTVKAIGNTVVEVVFENDVNAAAAGNKANYSIEGLAVNAVVVAGADTVRLETAAMTAGKLYTLSVGTENVKFSGIAKVSDGPQITGVVSEDVEEVVITFDRNLDYATATNAANYSIAGVEITKAEVDENEVTLTTVGLKNKTRYTVKATNLKSIDGVAKKSTSDTFTTKLDVTAPKIDSVEVQTNERIVVNFSEKVTKESAENIANYSIKLDETNGADLDIVSVTWDSDDENNVEIVTAPMEKREDYKLSVINIADQRKVANVMTRPATKVFEAIAADETAPVWNTITVLSPTKILVEFSDGSKFDEASALDLNNYTLENLNIESIETIKNDWKVFRALLTVEEMETGKSYDLTIADVQDEFGNTMKETTKAAKAIAGNLASAKLLTAVATGENKITLTFDKEVDEATAENIANYSIDEEVGAPTKATLKSDNKTVELEVNDLIDGYGEYDIVVNGVQDLAGNALYYKMKVNTATAWNTTAPKLEDANIVNKYVVALTFDEKVQFEADAKLILAENEDPNTTVALDAKDYADDNTVVEFSNGVALDPDKTYTVVGVVYGADVDGGIKDLVGNRFLGSTITFGDYEFEGVTDEPEAAEVVSYEQVNGTTFEVTMSRWVDVKDATQTANGVNFTVTADEDVLTFAGDKALEADEDYTFNFADFLADKHGFAAANSDTDTTTVLTAEDTDTVNPEIESVVAKNRETIKVTFSENIPAGVVQASDFELKNYDLDSSITISGVVDTTVGDNVIELTVAKPLESRYEYELTLKDASIADFVGLKNEDAATFYFNGSNLAK